MTPRITPGRRSDIGVVNHAAITVGARVAKVPGLPNLFTTMAKHRSLFRGWLMFAGRMMPRGKLPRRDTELVILRTAWLNRCEYELDHHRRIGAQAGLTADQIDAAASESLDGWTDRERAILSAADELHASHNLTDAAWTELRRHLSEREAIEFLLLVGHYEMLATFINTIGIELDHQTHRQRYSKPQG
ncbi:MAG: carboxymuconolactone decarboxylase family protein [Frankiaceae bacterium]|nr:carboxymuconolactone decarboxylase family protein [Frankiaceae bacterium]MBV9873058.1 carboxymuconolactone decarboxylase family protein [Frankiaceae bacterium]